MGVSRTKFQDFERVPACLEGVLGLGASRFCLGSDLDPGLN